MSISQAANELRVTPAAISHQIRILEDHVGLPLFIRNGRGLALTDAGSAGLRDLREGSRGWVLQWMLLIRWARRACSASAWRLLRGEMAAAAA